MLYCWWCIQMMFRRDYPFTVGDFLTPPCRGVSWNYWSTVVFLPIHCRGDSFNLLIHCRGDSFNLLIHCRGVKHPFSAHLPTFLEYWNISNLPRLGLFPIIDIMGNSLAYKSMLTRLESLLYKALRRYWPSRIAHYCCRDCLIIGFVGAIMGALSSVEGQIV